MGWTEEKVTLLRKLWGEGKTAAEIAKALGGGLTRNAVIGKAHRLKLSNRVSPIQQNEKIPAPMEKPEPKKIRTAGKAMKLIDLKDRMCRWPSGDPREANFHFCGEPVIPGLPYCAEHAKMAYQAASRSRLLQAEDFEERETAEADIDVKHAAA